VHLLWLRSKGRKDVIDDIIKFIHKKSFGHLEDGVWMCTLSEYESLSLYVPSNIKHSTFLKFHLLSSAEQTVLKIVAVFGRNVSLAGILFVIDNDESINRLISVSTSSSLSIFDIIKDTLQSLAHKGWLDMIDNNVLESKVVKKSDVPLKQEKELVISVDMKNSLEKVDISPSLSLPLSLSFCHLSLTLCLISLYLFSYFFDNSQLGKTL
jgi:hypothetical protein